jgi:16S rRNA U1498 N3-methylase RsmE
MAINQFLITDMEARRKKHQIQLIVSYLMQVLRIPDGNHLVLFFGSGQERDNRQALMSWVEIHIDEFDPSETEKRLRSLANKVVQTIQEQQWND